MLSKSPKLNRWYLTKSHFKNNELIFGGESHDFTNA